MEKAPNVTRVSNFVRTSGGSHIAGKVLLAASLLSGLFSANAYIESFAAEKEIEFRKRQLKLPVYKLTEEQHVNPPWNHENIDSWLYRRGTLHLTQSRSSADPSTVSPAPSPASSSISRASNLYSP
jgi:hypothetical protein